MTRFLFRTITFFLATVFICGCRTGSTDHLGSENHPNIVYILADDLGYGDVSCYYPEGKIKTPNIDRLASQGMRFTDAHAPSSVCTPTRYAILTGQYAWRSRLPQGVLRGYGRALIDANTPTVGSLLRDHGYHTAVIGKWHLGLDWHIKEGHEKAIQPGHYGVRENGMVTDMHADDIDFHVPPKGGPLSRGFDYSYILPASLDMEPYCYLQNDTLTELPSDHTPGNDLNTGYTGAFWRAGRIAPSFKFNEVLINFKEKALDYLATRARKKGEPFFLYLPFAAPHTPWVPTRDFEGRSEVGSYGDFVQMVDHMVGEVMQALDSLALSNTIVIFTSDNGPFWRPASIEKWGHRAAGPWRGMKADAYEGGHRIPFIVRWPGKIRAGAVSEAPTTLTNLFATCAELVGSSSGSRDSYSILSVLTGESDRVSDQRAIIHHSSMGHFAIREGKWKLIDKNGSGGFTEPSTYEAAPGEPQGQLYDLENDPGEAVNLYKQYPAQAEALKNLLEQMRATH